MARSQRAWTAVGLVAACAAAAAISAVPAIPAAADAGDGDGVTVTPVRIQRDVDSSSFDAVLQVRNRDRQPATVRLRTAGLGHDLHGTPRFRPDGAHADGLDVTPSRLELAGDERAQVRVRGELPSDGLYAAVLVEPEPEDRSASAVTLRARIAVLVLVRGPRPWQEGVAVDAVALRERDAGDAVLDVDVRNTGEVHLEPRGRATVVDADDRAVAEVALAGERVLPGHARRVATPVELPADAAGPFRVRVALDHLAEPVEHTAELERGAPEATARSAADPDQAGPGDTRVTEVAGVPASLLAVAVGLLAAVTLGVGWAGASRRARSGGTLAPPQAPARPGGGDPVVNGSGAGRRRR